MTVEGRVSTVGGMVDKIIWHWNYTYYLHIETYPHHKLRLIRGIIKALGLSEESEREYVAKQEQHATQFVASLHSGR